MVLVDSSSIKLEESPDTTIRLYVAGKEIETEVPPQIINGRTMVPVRFVAEALGAEVGWDGKTYTVTINKATEKYGYKREIKKQGKVVVSLEPDELYIVTSNNRAYERNPLEPEECAPEETVEKLIGQYIRKYLPDIKFKIYDWDAASEDDWLTSGVYPDIYIDVADRNTTRHIRTYGMEYDLTSMIEEYNLDLERLNKSAMNKIMDRGAGKIYSLPLEINDYVMFYNKKYFDSRNVEYPTSGMTYDEIFDLTRTMTYQEGFNQIKGWVQHPDQYLKLNQLGISFFSRTEANKVEINTEEFTNLVKNLHRFYDPLQISGNTYVGTDDFLRRGIAAMCVESLEYLPKLAGVKEYMIQRDADWWPANRDDRPNPDTWYVPTQWDIASVPVFPEAPNNIYDANVLSMFITKQSQMKKTAFEVVNVLLREDVQKGRAADGIKGVVKTEEIANVFGTNVPEYKNLNLKAVYWGENAAQSVRSPEVAGGGYWDISTWDIFRKYIFQYGLNLN